MLRQSVAPNRASQAPNVNSAAAIAKQREKKKEFEAVSALERASAQYLERINSLAGDFDVMADGGEGAHPEWEKKTVNSAGLSSLWPSPRTVAQNVSNPRPILYVVVSTS